MYQKVDWKNKRVSEMLPFKENKEPENKEQFIKVLSSCIRKQLKN